MNEETRKMAKEMLEIISASKDYSEIKDFNTLFIDCETIISALAWLIGPMLEAEQAYRKLTIGFMDEMDESHAKAEARAKASEQYKDWQKLKFAYELGQEQVMLIKKFSSHLELEYSRTK